MSDTEVDAMSTDSSDLMDEFEQSIQAFQALEDIHMDILSKLCTLQKDIHACDVDMLQKMHQDAMEHIKTTGITNFGELLLQ